MDIDDIRREEIKRALETRQRLRDTGIDLARMGSADQLVEEARKQAILPQERLAQPPSYTVNVKPFAEAIESLRRPIPWELIQRKKEFDDLLRNFGRSVVEIRDAVSTAAVPVMHFLERWQQANRQLEELIRTVSPDSPLGILMRASTNVYEMNASAVARRIVERDLIHTNPALGARLTLPTVSYVDFSSRTLQRISGSNDAQEKFTLGSSLIIAQEQVTQSTSLIEEVTAEPSQLVEVMSASTPADATYNSYDAAQQDLLSNAEIPADAGYQTLRDLSPSAAITEQTRALARAVIRCNKNNQLRGGEDIFKLTNTLADACVVLPGLIVRNEDDLRNLIFYLYMIFYEGAGKDKLRFIEWGFVTADDCGVIWTLKGLRNKWQEHDPEHGAVGDIRANYRRLNEALGDLGLSRFPREPREFEEIQRKLITELTSLATKIEDGIAAKASSTA